MQEACRARHRHGCKNPVAYAREKENAVNLPPYKAIKVRPAKIRVSFLHAQTNSKKIIVTAYR
ncbi:Hypothetical predicted protein [Olea europaea subsp. europaea]|uniref:Uncharacterized protein n=1 Tax=Olea europaea subsp. europaea TaxID=158383 RepID=A0A8S0S7B9_OLEEU|nr:Hypothetical predicted protein [Olea europaea subsp. europaea]